MIVMIQTLDYPYVPCVTKELVEVKIFIRNITYLEESGGNLHYLIVACHAWAKSSWSHPK